jgi:uncharacterized membrane protein
VLSRGILPQYRRKTTISDHENIGIDTLFMVLGCAAMQILTTLGFSVMVAPIKDKATPQTPDPAATHFYDEMHQNNYGVQNCFLHK